MALSEGDTTRSCRSFFSFFSSRNCIIVLREKEPNLTARWNAVAPCNICDTPKIVHLFNTRTQFISCKGALTRWYIPCNWSGEFYEAFFYFLFIKSGGPQNSARFIRSAGFYEVKIKNRVIKSAWPIPWYIPSCQRALTWILQQI
jgi:hypothetical protein